MEPLAKGRTPWPSRLELGMGPIPHPIKQLTISKCADNYSRVRSTPYCAAGDDFITVMDSSTEECR